jgi:hypothetical protein
MRLQLIENKALSWSIIQKSAPILAAIEDRKSQAVTPTATLIGKSFNFNEI